MLGFAAPGGAAKDIMDSTGGAVTLTVQAMPAPEGYDTYLMAGTPDAIAGQRGEQEQGPGARLHQLDVPARADQGRRRGRRATSRSAPPTAPPCFRSTPGWPRLIDEDKTAQYPYIDWPNGEVYNTLGTGVTGLLTGQMSVDDVLESMDKAWG